MQVVEKGAMDVLFTADASPWAPDASTCARVHQMLGEAHRCAADQHVGHVRFGPECSSSDEWNCLVLAMSVGQNEVWLLATVRPCSRGSAAGFAAM